MQVELAQVAGQGSRSGLRGNMVCSRCVSVLTRRFIPAALVARPWDFEEAEQDKRGLAVPIGQSEERSDPLRGR